MQEIMDVALEGSSRGHNFLMVNSFKFHKKYVLKCGTVKWVCDRQGKLKDGCKAVCYTEGETTTLKDGIFYHNHEADEKKYSRHIISNSCKRKANESPFEKPEKILKKEIEASSVSKNITERDLNQIRKTMWKKKRNELPPLPKSIEDTQEALDSIPITTSNGEQFLIENDREKKIVIFGCQTNVGYLKQVGRILVDGTFEYCCKHFTQLFTVLIEQDGHYVPVLYSLLPDKKQTTYKALFEKIKVLMGESPMKRIMADFEMSIHNAAKEVWPAADLFGCRFHLTQSWIRKIQNLGLMPEYKNKGSSVSEWLHLVFGLPHLKPEDVGLSFCEDLMADIPDNPRVKKFADYIVDTYVSEGALFPPTVWATFESQPVSNNPCESFHSKFKLLFYNAHPDIFTFVRQLIDHQILVNIKLQSLGEAPRPTGNMRYKSGQIKLMNAKEQYRVGSYSRKEYLKAASDRYTQ